MTEEVIQVKLTDEMRKKIIADYVDCENYSAVARKYNVSRTTVSNIVNGDSAICEKLHRKKEENTKNVLEYMSDKNDAVCELIDLYLNELVSPEKMKKATLNQMATALGIVIDKFTAVKAEGGNGEQGVVLMPEASDTS